MCRECPDCRPDAVDLETADGGIHIGYTSKVAEAAVADMSGEVDQALAMVRKRNQENDLDGALLVAADRFGQALAGDKDSIETTFKRISRDPCHHAIVTLHEEATTLRRFSQCAMAFVGDTPTLRSRYADAPLAALARQKSDDALLDFTAAIARDADLG